MAGYLLGETESFLSAVRMLKEPSREKKTISGKQQNAAT